MDQTNTFFLARRFFIRFLGLVYLFAFLSIWSQIIGLVGENGVLPVKDYLAAAENYYGYKNIFGLPTIFWLGQSNQMLTAVCGLGVVFSIVVVSGFFPFFALFTVWFLYLSIVHVGQTFMSFQWDILLLEAGFLSLFLCPWKKMLNTFEEKPPRWIIFAFRLLLFKLMFQSGLIKILSGDQNWMDLSALSYHYFTQPLPNLLSWYIYQQPYFVHQLLCLLMFLVELVVPLGIFMHRSIRLWCCLILIVYQVIVMLTGNYGFFNILGISLCFLLIDDFYFRRRVYDKTFAKSGRIPEKLEFKTTSLSKAKDAICQVVVGLLISLTFLNFVNMKLSLPKPVAAVMKIFKPYLINNNYGLFAEMSTTRTEVIIEGSHDGYTWTAYDFKYKPGNIYRNPVQVAPHQPRLDWQMWFAAKLPDYRYTPWFSTLLKKLLEGEKSVLKLLMFDPFHGKPPKYIRAKVFEYEFTSKRTKKKTEQWWERTEKGYFAPIIQLD